MKNIKGFTLVELLAVLVLLSIITLITIPIITESVLDSEKNSERVNAKNYIDAVNVALSEQKVINVKNNYNGTYEIVESGKYIQQNDNKIKIEYKGKGLESGILIIKNGNVEKLYNAKSGDWNIKYYNDKITVYEINGESTLVKGSEFNKTIKTLVDSSTSNYETNNLIIEKISFYSNGELPNGYTKNELDKLDNVSVSSDNKVNAYYDSEKKAVYVYSENQIYANETSNFMFGYLNKISEIDLLSLDTSKVKNAQSMFINCTNLIKLDLISFDISNVTSMHSMFKNSSNLKEITVSNKWVINSNTDITDMFTDCGTDHVTVK